MDDPLELGVAVSDPPLTSRASARFSTPSRRPGPVGIDMRSTSEGSGRGLWGGLAAIIAIGWYYCQNVHSLQHRHDDADDSRNQETGAEQDHRSGDGASALAERLPVGTHRLV